MRPIQPTSETYGELQKAFDFFNVELFHGELPCCLMTLQRQRGARGYFSSDRFESRVEEKDQAHEIALNPACFRSRTDEDIFSTLVHEQVHLWQQVFGKPGRGRYHNQEWAAKMEEVGLCPSTTGEPGGRRTGDRVSHYIVKGGPFERAYKKLRNDGVRLSWSDRFEQEGGKAKVNKSNREKYTCPDCGLNAWAKPEAALMCGECMVAMEADGSTGDDVSSEG